MIRFLLPVLAVLVVLGSLLLCGRGWESLGDPGFWVAVVFLVGVSCLPLLRHVVKTQQWPASVPWLGVVLVWNDVGALLAMVALLEFALQHLITFPEPLLWCIAVFWWVWFLPMPFTSLGVAVVLGSNRSTLKSKLLLLYSFVIFAVWCGLAAVVVLSLTKFSA